MKPVNEIVPKDTPPCEALEGSECRVVMKSVKEMVHREDTNELVEETIEKPVNEIVPKGTPACDAPIGSECRIVMTPSTKKVQRTV